MNHRPLHGLLALIAAVCFVATLVTDLVYAETAAMQWSNMSDWMLLAGLTVLVVATVAGLIDFGRDVRLHRLPGAWMHTIGNAAVLVLAFFDELIHTRDAYTSVVPSGLILSALVVLIMLLSNWSASRLRYRYEADLRQTERP